MANCFLQSTRDSVILSRNPIKQSLKSRRSWEMQTRDTVVENMSQASKSSPKFSLCNPHYKILAIEKGGDLKGRTYFGKSHIVKRRSSESERKLFRVNERQCDSYTTLCPHKHSYSRVLNRICRNDKRQYSS